MFGKGGACPPPPPPSPPPPTSSRGFVGGKGRFDPNNKGSAAPELKNKIRRTSEWAGAVVRPAGGPVAAARFLSSSQNPVLGVQAVSSIRGLHEFRWGASPTLIHGLPGGRGPLRLQRSVSEKYLLMGWVAARGPPKDGSNNCPSPFRGPLDLIFKIRGRGSFLGGRSGCFFSTNPRANPAQSAGCGGGGGAAPPPHGSL